MQKTILGSENFEVRSSPRDEWFGMDAIAGIEVTSEEDNAPVESILEAGSRAGWRAGGAGLQLIRITFSEPKMIRRIRLEFAEPDIERTQEFTLRWSTALDTERTEIVRQQWTFSPKGSTEEIEDYRCNLNNVVNLELVIDPDLTHGTAHASLRSLQIG